MHVNLPIFVLAFVTGSVVATFGELPTPVWPILLPILSLLCIFLLAPFVMNVAFFRRTSVYNLLLLTIGTLLGLLAYDVHNPQRLNLHYTNQITLDETYTVVARIEQQPQRTPKRLKSVVEMNEVRVGDTCIPVCGKTIIYFDTIYNTLNVGDEVVFSGRLTQVAEDIGIEGLNWRKVMKQRKIYAQCFVDDLALLKKGGGKVKYVDRLRSWVAQRIEAAGLTERQEGIAKALIIGDKEAPLEETRARFRASGLSHVLCVSGLHVGIVAAIVMSLLWPMRRNRQGIIVSAATTVAAVWGFVALSGMAPSSTRAATMFSFIIIGQTLINKPPTLNAISLAALVMLMLNPMLVADIGFELSFAAVTGIVVFATPIERKFRINRGRNFATRKPYVFILYVSRKIAQKSISYVVVCIVAQLATLPLVLYYFHFFAPWFLIANLLIVPFVGIILVSLIFMVLFAPVEDNIVSRIVGWELETMCDVTDLVSSLPGATVESIRFTAPMLLVATLMLLSAGIAVEMRDDNPKKLYEEYVDNV